MTISLALRSGERVGERGERSYFIAASPCSTVTSGE